MTPQTKPTQTPAASLACAPSLQLWDLRNTASPLREYTGHTQDTTACVFLNPRKEEEGFVGGGRRGGEGGGGGGKKDENGVENDDDVVCCNPSPSPSYSSSSHRRIATASKDGSIKIYDRDSGKLALSLVGWLVCCVDRSVGRSMCSRSQGVVRVCGRWMKPLNKIYMFVSASLPLATHSGGIPC